MQTGHDRLQFAPPPQPGLTRAFALAVAAHLLLVLALTWGVNWTRDSDQVQAEAELWSPTVQQAAPKLVEAPPPPPPPEVKPAPPPRPVADTREADIALEREKKRKLDEARARDEERERLKKLEAQKKLDEAKKLAEQKKAEELKKQDVARKADDRKKAEAAKLAKAQEEEAQRMEAQRQDNLKRMQGLAGATGGADATGGAQRASGPSESYGGRIQAKVRPNIVFGDDVNGNPSTLVEVRLSPDGTITSRRILKPSGVKSWDEAVLRALDKTEVLPRDVDGRIHTPLEIKFSPRG